MFNFEFLTGRIEETTPRKKQLSGPKSILQQKV